MGRKKAFEVELSDAEKASLQSIVKQGHHAARVIRRAQSLLWMAEGKSDQEIVALQGVSVGTLSNTRKKWGLEKSVEDQARAGRPRLLDGKQEAFLVALTCSDAPEGREAWTMQLLADQLLSLQVVEAAISDETVRRILQKKH